MPTLDDKLDKIINMLETKSNVDNKVFITLDLILEKFAFALGESQQKPKMAFNIGDLDQKFNFPIKSAIEMEQLENEIKTDFIFKHNLVIFFLLNYLCETKDV